LCPGSTRFPRQARLTGPAGYRRVFNSCQHRVSNRWITVLASPNSLDHPRLGLAISRKVARTAVARNRIKRAVRESFRQHQGRLQDVDIVVLGRNGIADRTGRELAAALESLWTRLNESCAGSSSD
jgi:ribonuclease P protein component